MSAGTSREPYLGGVYLKAQGIGYGLIRTANLSNTRPPDRERTLHSIIGTDGEAYP